MKVYKFGGASVRNADGVRNLRKIIDEEQHLFIIVSAMGKTTNALKGSLRGCSVRPRRGAGRNRRPARLPCGDHRRPVARSQTARRGRAAVRRTGAGRRGRGRYRAGDAELWYDTIVAYGELVSTTIISEYLNYAGVPNRWIDMRRCFLTEQRHKDAGVDIEASAPRLREAVAGCPRRFSWARASSAGRPTARPRRSAARFGLLGRRGGQHPRCRVDVGVEGCGRRSECRSEDLPPDAVQIAELNYLDTIELAYSGAQIIHPKTIKPLQNKNIPLYVRPFGDKRKPGTVIRGMSAPVDVPILILKKRPGAADDPFARLLVRARGEVRHDLLAARTLPHQGQSDPQFGGQSEPLRRQFVAYRRGGRRVAPGGFRRDEDRPHGAADHPGLYPELWRRYAIGRQVFIRQATQATVRIVRRCS